MFVVALLYLVVVMLLPVVIQLSGLQFGELSVPKPDQIHLAVYGINEERVIDIIIMHMFEYHATKSDEMTSYIRLKITENTNVPLSPT
jgi:predicted transporter